MIRVALALTIALAGCEKKQAPAPSSTEKLPPLPPGGAWPTAEMLSMSSPSYRNDIGPVLERMCASQAHCHGREPTDSVSLDLLARDSWRQLVNAPAEGRKGTVRIKPGDPAGSFLVDKLSGRLQHGEGKKMPIDAVTGAPIEPSPIDQQYLDYVLLPWIKAGARRN